MNLFKTHLTHCQNQRGISLLEILIALAISSIMLLSITNIYEHFINASNQQKEQSLAQDQANFAFLALKHAVRMSGAGLCVRPTIKSKTYFHQKAIFDSFPSILQKNNLNKFSASSRLHSFSNPTNNDLGVGDELKLVKNSDALLTIYSDSNTRRINAVIEEPSGRKLPPQEASIYHDRQFAENRKPKDDFIFYDNGDENKPQLATTWVMVSDCEHTGVYKYSADTTSLSSEKLNILPNPDIGGDGFLYNFSGNGQESLAARLYAKLFFVARDNQTNISHLYVRDLLAPDKNPKSIAPFVQSMKVEYLNLETGTWEDTASYNHWDKNWPVRISLTMYGGTQYGGTKDDPLPCQSSSCKKPIPEDDKQIYTRILDIRN